MARYTLSTLPTHAVRDLTTAETREVFKGLKARVDNMRTLLRKSYEALGLDVDEANDTSPLGRTIRLYNGPDGLLAVFAVDEDEATKAVGQNPRQLSIDDELQSTSAETGGMLKRPIEHSDGPPRTKAERDDAAEAADTQSILSEPPGYFDPPTTQEIEASIGIADDEMVNIVLATIAQDDIDAAALRARVKNWSQAMRRRAADYCNAASDSASDNDDVVVPPIPRLLYDAMCASSAYYRNLYASMNADQIDDSPLPDVIVGADGSEVVAVTTSEEAMTVHLTPAQLGALQIIAESNDATGISQSMIKKLRAAKVIERSAENLENFVATALGREVVEWHAQQTGKINDDEHNKA